MKVPFPPIPTQCVATLSTTHAHKQRKHPQAKNSGMSGRRASRTDIKGTSICCKLQARKVTLRRKLMLMESSAGSGLLELLEAAEALTFGYSLGAGNG